MLFPRRHTCSAAHAGYARLRLTPEAPRAQALWCPSCWTAPTHVAWFRAGETIFEPSGINYLGVPGLINAHNIIATLIVQVRATCPCPPPARSGAVP